ncbi:uncharacterized protein [Littorina saxatilis]|uniref:Uncharacterized protein n=1 Tax=Littorina saxatilis TaxID=31220 RepID=A0AAN9B6G5_9CAEN
MADNRSAGDHGGTAEDKGPPSSKQDLEKETTQESQLKVGLWGEGDEEVIEYPVLFPDCEKCKEYQGKNGDKLFFLFHQDDIVRPDGTIRKKSLHKFFKHINALMNVKGGIIFIHSQQCVPFRPFDIAVDDRINGMIADATLFHSNFDRLFLDYNHCIFRVKDTNSPNVSTFRFFTDLLINERLVDPTQGNMRKIVEDCASEAPYLGSFEAPYHHRAPKEFRAGEQVQMYQGFSTHLHHADLDLISQKDGKDMGAKALNYWWEDFDLPNYITAVCKLRVGGSLYLGMRPEDPIAAEREKEKQQQREREEGKEKGQEEQQEEGKEEESEDSDDESAAKIRCTSSSGSDSDSEPPRRSRRMSILTKFFADGLKLTTSDRETFEAELERRIKDDMMWYPSYPSDEGQVATATFHTLIGGETDMCVIEVKVKRFNGMAFYNKTGPEAFNAVKRDGKSVIERVPFKEYITRFDFNSFI